LTVPLFVLFFGLLSGVFLNGVVAQTIQSEEIPEGDLSKLLENDLFPSKDLDENEDLPKTLHPIIERTVSSDSNILNETNYTIKEKEILKYAPSYSHASPLPLVLIVHTHGTECYSETTDYYDETLTKTRTEDTNKNVVAVGRALCDELIAQGIPTLHYEQMFDKDNYNDAYKKSGAKIEEYLKEYPSIKLVIDVHRDSLVSQELVKIKTVAEKGCAQVMIVAGSDAGGAVYPNWKRNLALSLKIKEVMDKSYPSLSRPILLRGARYNQHLAYSSFLLEVGTCANTLEEAKTAAGLCAECVAEVILNP
jgi:stage II sporulation protein P